MSKLTILIIGLVLGYATPLAIDYAMFNTITPCHSVSVSANGNSVQKCEVKK